MGFPQVLKPQEQEHQAEVPEPTPAPNGTSRDVTTVTLLLRAPLGSTPSSPASPESSPSTTSPEPPLESAKAQGPAAEALGSPEPPPSPPRAPSPEPQEPPATLNSDRQVVNKVSLDEGQGCQADELLSLGVRPCPCPVPLQLLHCPTEPTAAQGPTKGLSDTKRAGEGSSRDGYGICLPGLPFPAWKMGSCAHTAPVPSGPGSSLTLLPLPLRCPRPRPGPLPHPWPEASPQP